MPRQIQRNVAHKQRNTRYADYCNLIESATPDAAINPFVIARSILEFTQAKVAEDCGISKQALIRLEQGVPDKPIEAVTYYYVRAFARTHPDYDYLWFVNGYELFQIDTRRKNKRIFGNFEPGFFYDFGTHTLTLLLNNWSTPDGQPVGRMNVTEASKLLCINQSILDHWLKKPHRQQTVPKVFLEALRTNGYSVKEIERVELHYEWHRYRLSGGDPTPLVERANRPSLKEAILSEF